MSVRGVCPECGARYRVESGPPRATVACQACGVRFRLPSTGIVGGEPAAESGASASIRVGSAITAPPRPRRESRDNWQPAPQSPLAEMGVSPGVFWAWLGSAMALVLLAAVLLFVEFVHFAPGREDGDIEAVAVEVLGE